MDFKLMVGDTIYYGDSFEFKHEDVIEKEVAKNKKVQYFGVYVTNYAHTEHFSSLEALLESYLNSWENVKVYRNGKEYILKDFKRDIEKIRDKNRIVLERQLTKDIRIEILKYSFKAFTSKERFYYLEYNKDELIRIERINF